MNKHTGWVIKQSFMLLFLFFFYFLDMPIDCGKIQSSDKWLKVVRKNLFLKFWPKLNNDHFYPLYSFLFFSLPISLRLFLFRQKISFIDQD